MAANPLSSSPNRHSTIILLSAALSFCSATACADIRVEGGSAIAAYSADSQVIYGTRDYLKVSSDGKRFISEPYGEAEAIRQVVSMVKQFGAVTRTSTRGLRVPDAARREVLTRYDLVYPASCGAPAFSYYEGAGFSAIGYHFEDKLVLDALNNTGPFSAPRLWGPYDQVVNANMPMRLLIGNGEDDGQGFMRAGYQVGLIPNLTTEQQAWYGNAYSASIQMASRCRASVAQATISP